MRKLIAFCLFLFSAPASVAAQVPWTVTPGSAEIPQGGVLALRVSGDNLAAVRARFGNREIAFFPDGPSYLGVFGVDLEEKPGPKEIVVQAWSGGGRKSEKIVTVDVKRGIFPEEQLSVDPGFDRIDEALRQRIEREQAELARLWATASPLRLWRGGFVPPVPGHVTAAFGLRRVVNGIARSPHSGVDLKAPLGAPVAASNHGRVVLREDFFFSGKSIVLDHGAGLYTMYYHLADFQAEKGALVRRGDTIGRAGMTGRVTGPHLHWGARLNGARVDPLELIKAISDK